MAEFGAFITASNVPLTGPVTLPRLTLYRTSDDTLVVNAQSMTEIGQGLYRYTFVQDPTLQYFGFIDADPLAAGQVSVQERYQSIELSGITDARIETDIPLLRYGGAVHIDVSNGSAGTAFPIGTPESPVNNLADAVTIAAAIGVRKYVVRGNLTLTSAHDDWVFEGAGGEGVIAFNNQDVADSEFRGIELSGIIGNGPIITKDCLLDGVTSFSGLALNSRFRNNTGFAVGTTTLIGCTSEVPGTSAPIFDLVGAGRNLNLRAYSGGVDLRNVVDAGQNVTLELIAGQVILDSSITNGSITLRGIGNLTDNSVGGTIETNAFLNISAIYAKLVDGTVDVSELLVRLNAFVRGRIVKDTIDPNTFDIEYYEEDNTTIAFENRKTAALRTPQ